MRGFDHRDELTYAGSMAGQHIRKLRGKYSQGRSNSGYRIGIVTNLFASDLEPGALSVNTVMQHALTKLDEARVSLENVEIKEVDRHLSESSVLLFRAKHDINRYLSSLPFSPAQSLEEILSRQDLDCKVSLLHKITTSSSDLSQDSILDNIYDARDKFLMAIVGLMNRNSLDALLYPTSRVTPPSIAEIEAGRWHDAEFPTNTLVASQAWMPAMSIPAGRTDAGLPVGMEIAVRPFDEMTLFNIGFICEAVLGVDSNFAGWSSW